MEGERRPEIKGELRKFRGVINLAITKIKVLIKGREKGKGFSFPREKGGEIWTF